MSSENQHKFISADALIFFHFQTYCSHQRVHIPEEIPCLGISAEHCRQATTDHTVGDESGLPFAPDPVHRGQPGTCL